MNTNTNMRVATSKASEEPTGYFGFVGRLCSLSDRFSSTREDYHSGQTCRHAQPLHSRSVDDNLHLLSENDREKLDCLIPASRIPPAPYPLPRSALHREPVSGHIPWRLRSHEPLSGRLSPSGGGTSSARAALRRATANEGNSTRCHGRARFEPPYLLSR